MDDTGTINYNTFMRQLECHGTYKIWYQSGKWLYGGNAGIDDVTIKANEIIAESNDEIKVIQLTFMWKSKFSPEKTELNPIE
jgi:hypothetical protein